MTTPHEKTSRSRGRPREFDESEVLDRLVDHFWKHGFDGTNLDGLLESAGLARQSLYRAFGNKRQVFLRALERYGQRQEAFLRDRLLGASSARAGLLEFIDYLESAALKPGSLGCFTQNSLVEFGGTEDEEVHDLIQRSFLAARDVFVEALTRAGAAREIHLTRSPVAVANSILGLAHVLSQFGRFGAPAEVVKDIAEGVRQELSVPRGAIAN